jgi:hypothetical protein
VYESPGSAANNNSEKPRVVEGKDRREQFDWRLPLYAAVAALILFVPLLIGGLDILEMPYIFVAVPIFTLALLIAAVRKKGARRLTLLGVAIVYAVVSWGLFRNSRELRTTGRWLLWSKEYKAKVLSQPTPSNEALRHIEWDGWGYAGVGNTIVYLVFDPNDSLLAAAKTHSSGKFGGLPCEVARVRRLEKNYYTVLFYTDTEWDSCN